MVYGYARKILGIMCITMRAGDGLEAFDALGLIQVQIDQ